VRRCSAPRAALLGALPGRLPPASPSSESRAIGHCTQLPTPPRIPAEVIAKRIAPTALTNPKPQPPTPQLLAKLKAAPSQPSSLAAPPAWELALFVYLLRLFIALFVAAHVHLHPPALGVGLRLAAALYTVPLISQASGSFMGGEPIFWTTCPTSGAGPRAASMKGGLGDLVSWSVATRPNSPAAHK
jgi:hypothetical protein